MIELAGYEYIGPLGVPGNFGTVFHARNVLSGQEVAIKHIDEKLSPDALSAWEAEARAMAACQHDNLVRILHAEVTTDGPALVMEYMSEGSVAAKYGAQSAPVGDVIDIAVDVCWGLHRLHLAGLTHRDIKPGNLLLNGKAIKLGDFGLAARTGDPADLIYVPHKPPELAHGDPWTETADIYALAVTAWRLLWGDEGAGRLSVDFVERIDAGRWPAVDEWPLHVHKRLRTVLRKALHRDPKRRYDTAAEFRSALEKARPVVSWSVRGTGTWSGDGGNCRWDLEIRHGASGSSVECRRDTGNGARRVTPGCTGPMPELQAFAAAQTTCESIAVNGTL